MTSGVEPQLVDRAIGGVPGPAARGRSPRLTGQCSPIERSGHVIHQRSTTSRPPAGALSSRRTQLRPGDASAHPPAATDTEPPYPDPAGPIRQCRTAPTAGGRRLRGLLLSGARRLRRTRQVTGEVCCGRATSVARSRGPTPEGLAIGKAVRTVETGRRRIAASTHGLFWKPPRARAVSHMGARERPDRWLAPSCTRPAPSVP
jgi:hypothetical protein